MASLRMTTICGQPGILLPVVGAAAMTTKDVYHQGAVGIVRDSLAILPPRQREVMAKVHAGYWISDIAEALGIPPLTVRSNLRYGARNSSTHVRR